MAIARIVTRFQESTRLLGGPGRHEHATRSRNFENWQLTGGAPVPLEVIAGMRTPQTGAAPRRSSTFFFHSSYPARPIRPKVATLPVSTAGWS